MSERPPLPPGDVPGQPWDPNERVGDVYEVQVGTDGEITQTAKLSDEAETAPTGEREPDDQPRIWVGSWSDYNNGILHGRWIDAARDEDELWSDIQATLAASPTARKYGEPAEEWGIFDYENFGPLRIGEQERLSWVSKVARGIAEHGKAFAAYADVIEDEAALDGFADDYLGQYESVRDYVEQLCDDMGCDRLLDAHLPEGLRRYVAIDYDGVARDMLAGGDIHVVEAESGGVWIFNGG